MNKRNYGIDLYGVFLTYLICILHVINQGGILTSFEEGTINSNVVWIFETSAMCCVDGYALISSYNSREKDKNYSKIIYLWIKVFFYSFIFSFVLYFIGFEGDMSSKTILWSALPMTSCTYWYFSAYVPLFLLEPYIVKSLNKLKDNDLTKVFIIIIIIFSISGAKFDAYRTSDGYSFVWIFLLYVLGYALKRFKFFEKLSNYQLVLISIILVAISWLSFILLKRTYLIGYLSPSMLFISMLLLILFSRIKPNKKIISLLSPLTFGIYLVQCNRIVWQYLNGRFVFVGELNPCLLFIVIIGLALVLFVVCALIDYIVDLLFKLLKIDIVSRNTNNYLLKIIDKLSNILSDKI